MPSLAINCRVGSFKVNGIFYELSNFSGDKWRILQNGIFVRKVTGKHVGHSRCFGDPPLRHNVAFFLNLNEHGRDRSTSAETYQETGSSIPTVNWF